MNLKIKNIFGYFLILLMIAITNASCSRIFNKSNLTATQRYLQSATWNEALADNYGYSESNPIVLKLSADLNYELIIDEFIARLWSDGEGESEGGLKSFTIEEKLKIPNKKHQSQKKESQLINECSRWIYAYKITSVDKKEKFTLFFELNPKSKNLYRPSGFMYSMIAG